MTTRVPLDMTALGDDFTRDPYPFYEKLRARGPVHRVHLRDGEPGWLVVGLDASRKALADPRLAKENPHYAELVAAGEVDSWIYRNMLELDPPHHTRLRKLVAREFTARRTAALAPRVQRIADGLLDAMLAEPERRADLVESLALPLPLTVICELLGVPFMERDQFRSWSGDLLTPLDGAHLRAVEKAMDGYLRDLIAAKRKAAGDDLLSALIRASDEDGDRLSTDELVGMAYLLLVAGHETTVGLISGGTLALLRHPDQLAALRADFDGLLENAVEEMLRYDGPVEHSTYRFPTEDVTFEDGTVVPAGDTVLVVLASAGRDPERFAEAGRFDIRRDTKGHVAFGHGPHFCLGAPLARLEGRIAVRTLLERAPDLALDAPPELLTWRPTVIVRGLESLPVRW